MAYKKYRACFLKGKVLTADATVSMNNDYCGLDSSGGEFSVTFPDVASNFAGYPAKEWGFRKMDDSNNPVILKLETPSDSMYGCSISSMKLYQQGDGVLVQLNANGKYTFSDWSGNIETAHPNVITLTPILSGTTLTMKGDLTDLGSFDSVVGYFRYRQVGGTAWTETTHNTLLTTGEFTDTATVTTGVEYEVQAIIEDTFDAHYGAVLDTDLNYYSSVTEAENDGLVWGSRIQEGTGLTSADVMGIADISWTGVTWGSDTINSQTINKVLLASSNFGEALKSIPFTSSSYSILLQIQNDSSSGDHTMINFGRNILSVASDVTSVQLEVNGNLAVWTSATPFSAIKNIWILVNRTLNRTYLYEVTSSTVTLRATYSGVPSRDGQFIRLGRGASGDANHQDFEYLDNGAIRSAWIWEVEKTEEFMKNIADTTDNNGGQVV